MAPGVTFRCLFSFTEVEATRGALLFAEEDEGVDGEGAASGDPGCDKAEDEHGCGDAKEDSGIFRR